MEDTTDDTSSEQSLLDTGADTNAEAPSATETPTATQGYVNPDGTFAEGWANNLPEDSAAYKDTLAEFNARSGPALRTLVKEHGVIVRGLPEDVLMACGEKSNEVLNEIYAADTSPDRIVRRIIEDFLEFRREIIPWTRIGEQAYLNARRLPFDFKLK